MIDDNFDDFYRSVNQDLPRYDLIKQTWDNREVKIKKLEQENKKMKVLLEAFADMLINKAVEEHECSKQK